MPKKTTTVFFWQQNCVSRSDGLFAFFWARFLWYSECCCSVAGQFDCLQPAPTHIRLVAKHEGHHASEARKLAGWNDNCKEGATSSDEGRVFRFSGDSTLGFVLSKRIPENITTSTTSCYCCCCCYCYCCNCYFCCYCCCLLLLLLLLLPPLLLLLLLLLLRLLLAYHGFKLMTAIAKITASAKAKTKYDQVLMMIPRLFAIVAPGSRALNP